MERRNREQKALFLDVDGTLLNDHRELTEKNKKTLDRLRREGHRIIINTGRPLVGALGLAKELELDGPGCYLAAFNGGLLYDFGHHEVIYRSTLPLQQVRLVAQEARRRKLHVQMYDDTRVFVEPHCDDEEVRWYCGRLGMEYKIIPDVGSLIAEPMKLSGIAFHNRQALEEFAGWIRKNMDGQVDAFLSSDTFLEIVRYGQDKGSALLWLVEKLQIPHENTIAVGDAANDIPMLKAAWLGIAMQNATEDVKEAADVILTRDNNHDGICEVAEKYIWNQ